MTLTSKSYRPNRSWLDIPSEIMADIFSRIGVIDLLENAQKAVCRSQGQLVDLAMLDFCNGDFLFCFADRSSQLRSLDISCSSRYLGDISTESIQKVGCHCPMLEALKMNKAVVFGSRDWEEGRIYNDTTIAIAIGENMRELKHLELFGNNMLNDGLKVILDGCPHIESLDLRQCNYNDEYDNDDDDDYNGDNDDYYNEDNGPLYFDSKEFVDYENVADNDGDDDDFSNF
uniref:Uncharacterized protein n=1 Tax=Tanacetum cinerariifolium TaxID=118510 RepID=A0A6L2KTG2_TANCI|nr:hypothetical protein [Tanacetum cinerariifolium]